jgi:hypothetical protein
MKENHVRQRLLGVAAVAVLTGAGLAAPAAAQMPLTGPGGAVARADFNGDGFNDVLVATGARLADPGDPDLSGNDRGGSVYLIPGGTTLPGVQPVLVSQDSLDFVTGAGEDDDHFGRSLVTGDFNGDGLADLAVGNPTESLGTKANAGMVTVLYGSTTAPYLKILPAGLSEIQQGTAGMPGDVEAGDLFGASLAVGDFDADGYADLAIGAPGEALGSTAQAGTAVVVYGSSSGLTAIRPLAIEQDTAGVPGDPEIGDMFGWSMAAGDVTGDGRDDLAIDASGEAITGYANATGMVTLVPGSATGLKPATSSAAAVNDAGTKGALRSVVIGKFHGGAYADVLVAGEQKSTVQFSGVLVALRGGADGITKNRVQVIAEGSAGVAGTPEENDYFGGSMAVGDLDGDGTDDLATGALQEDGIGVVYLMRGGSAGLLSAPATVVSEDTPEVGGVAQPGEGFGYGLRILDVNADSKPELLVTAPWEDGVLQAGTMFSLEVGVSGDKLAVTGGTTVSRSALGDSSHFGPATPIAGGAAMLMNNTEAP